MQTYLIYTGLLVYVFLLSEISERTQKKKYVFHIIIALSLIAGLRKETVGIDTVGYIAAFKNISMGRLDLTYGLEWSFRYICYVLSFVLKDPQLYLVLFSFITNGLIVVRLWELRKRISFKWSLVAYYIMFYIMSLNLMRQFIAIAIVFYATRFLEKEKNIAFLLFIIIASLFHKSSLLGIILIFINFPAWKYLSKRQKKYMLFILFISPFALSQVYTGLMQYSRYFEQLNFGLGMMIIVKIMIVIITQFSLNRSYIKDKDNTLEDINRIKYLEKTTSISYIIGLLLTSLGYVWKFVSRAGLYFYVFEAIYIGFVFKQRNTRNNFIIKTLFLFIMCYQMICHIVGNGQGQHPYLFFWQ